MHRRDSGAHEEKAGRATAKAGERLPQLCVRCRSRLPTGARFCPACGLAVGAGRLTVEDPKLLAQEYPLAERKIITILFADFVGFTAFVRKHDPEAVHEWLGSVWREVDAIIAAHGGTVSKHIGDAVMALFGEKRAREDAPAQAVRAGLAIQEFLSRQKTEAVQSPPEMRIGIHSGMVVLEQKSPAGEFRATGDAINLANRLEESALPGRILISHETFRSVYGLFDLEPVGPLAVEGIAENVRAYLVGRAKPRAVARQLRDIEGVSTEMVGRKEELQRLQTAFRDVLDQRQAQVMTVLGEAGIGKSRLLQEFQHWAELLPDRFWFFLGQATADMPTMPFALIRDMFASRFEILDSDPPSVARRKLEDGVFGLAERSGLSRTLASQEIRQAAHFIGYFLGLDSSASPYLRGLVADPQLLRTRAFSALRYFLRRLACSPGNDSEDPPARGILIVAEDIHWSDQGSLDVLEDLAQGCADAPLLILCLARPALVERRSNWGISLPAHTRLNLDSLTLEESRALVSTILRKAATVPASLRDLVTDMAEGNPFYIEEFIKMLIDQAVISPGPGRWKIEMHRLVSTRVPQTLTGVLQARLDGLSTAERAVLQRAAVIGRVFWDRAIESLGAPANGSANCPGRADELFPEGSVRNALEGLCRKELILPRGASAFADATEYTFKHELLRNAAYEGLLRKLRRELHARVAAWLIERSGERSAEFAAQVASHYENAERPMQAAEWYGRAGDQARAGYEPAMAIECLRKAVDLLPARQSELEANRLDWLCSLMESLSDQARFKEAGLLGAAIRRRAQEAGDLVAHARAWNSLAFLHERRAANRASVAAAEKAENLARQAGKSGLPQRIRAMHFKGWAFYRLADWSAVLRLARRTQDLCSRLGDRPGLAASLKLQGVVHLQRGHFERADKCFEKGLKLCDEFGDRRNAAAMVSNLGESARLRGDYAAAADYYEKALAIARQIGSRESELVYLSNLSGARIGLQQFAQAEAGLRHLIPLASTRTSSMLAEAYSFLAEACLGQGKRGEALEAARRSIELARLSGNELDAAIGWRALAQTAAAPGIVAGNGGQHDVKKSESPVQCFKRSLRLFRKIDAEAEQARTLRAWALFDLQCGRAAVARQRIQTARRIFSRLRMRQEVAATDKLHSPSAPGSRDVGSSPPASFVQRQVTAQSGN